MNHAQYLLQKKKRDRTVSFFSKMHTPLKVEVEGDTFIGSCIPSETRSTADACNLLRVKRVSLEKTGAPLWVTVLLSDAANHLMGQHSS